MEGVQGVKADTSPLPLPGLRNMQLPPPLAPSPIGVAGRKFALVIRFLQTWVVHRHEADLFSCTAPNP